MAEEDLLWGKNRHLFGGIAPSNMLKFKAVKNNGQWFLDARLPKDTVVDGQTLCSVEGAVIRYNTTGYPVNEFDGYPINLEYEYITTDSLIPLDHITQEVIYFAAFPYSTQGVFNRNDANRTVANMPENNAEITAKSIYRYDESPDKASIQVKVTIPEKDIHKIDWIEVRCTFTDGGTVRYVEPRDMLANIDIYGAPTCVFEECFIPLGGTCQCSVKIAKHLEDGSYVWGTEVVSTKITATKGTYVFGYDLDLNDPDPSTRVSYPDDVDNADFYPVKMNIDTDRFDYGDWNIEPGEKFMPRPCMLKYDGTVDHYLDPNDYTKRDDGVTVSRVADVDFEGNAMMEWPKIYTHREEVDGIYKFRCSDAKLGEDWDCWCNYDIYDNEIDRFYTSIYTASCPNEDATTGTRLRSISGKTRYTAEYYATVRTKARYRVNSSARYDSWDIGLLADHLLIQDLLVLMAKNTDCSSVYGMGASSDQYYRANVSGIMDTKGLFGVSKGKSGENKDGVKVFGMEHYWGNDWRHIAGWSITNGKQYIKITKGAHDGIGNTSDAADTKYNRFDAGTSNKKCIVSSPFSTATGYAKSAVTTPYGRFPTNADGTLTTYECDVVKWSNNTSSNVGMVGGCSSNHENGPFAVQAYNSQTSTSGQATTLSCKPPLATP